MRLCVEAAGKERIAFIGRRESLAPGGCQSQVTGTGRDTSRAGIAAGVVDGYNDVAGRSSAAGPVHSNREVNGDDSARS